MILKSLEKKGILKDYSQMKIENAAELERENQKRGRLSKLIQNYTFHNLVGHPLMEICYLVGHESLGEKIHNITVPPNLSYTP